MLETPIDSFLRKEQTAKHRLPAGLRQGKVIRITFFIIGLTAFFVTLLFLLVRPGGAQGFFQSYTCFLPIWAALTVLPVTGPVYLYLLESIGTSRILATAHPLAANQRWNKDRGGTLIKPSARLLGEALVQIYHCYDFVEDSYNIANQKGALSSKSVESSLDTLLKIPPASLYLLEKLGVVTALLHLSMMS